MPAPLPSQNGIISQIGASGNPIFTIEATIASTDTTAYNTASVATSNDIRANNTVNIAYGSGTEPTVNNNSTSVVPSILPTRHINRFANDIHSILLFLERLYQAQFDDIFRAYQDIQANIFVDSTTIDFTFDSDTNITTAEILGNSITTNLMVDKAITFAKIQDITGKVLLGRDTGTGSIGTITLGTGLSMSNSILSSTAAVDFDTILVDASGNVVTSGGNVLVNS